MIWITTKLRWTPVATVIYGLAVVGALSLLLPSRAQEVRANSTVLNPDPASALKTQAVPLSAEQREAMLARERQLRQLSAATAPNNPPSPPGLAPVGGKGTQPVDATQFPSAPGN